MMTTYQYRIKDANEIAKLKAMSSSVNFVWNYCNEQSCGAVKNHSRWLSEYDLNNLTGGCSKELGLHSQTVQAICAEYVTRRKQFKKRQLLI